MAGSIHRDLTLLRRVLLHGIDGFPPSCDRDCPGTPGSLDNFHLLRDERS